MHTKTTSNTKETVVGGVTEGLLEQGDYVTWEAIHFGVKQRVTAKITEMDPPYTFTDVMVKGAFHSFIHIHEFIENGKGGHYDGYIYIKPLFSCDIKMFQ
ncbi:SRPBCC family protein [Domibacillus epiphyticus]|uniref:SRPBCC family protein n=1 Tax=Domibacillus epiphyticus TaxID=1714355 RepID=UPI0018E99FED|nr:hypothetical protein [Domibacillus epiphyticus]